MDYIYKAPFPATTTTRTHHLLYDYTNTTKQQVTSIVPMLQNARKGTCARTNTLTYTHV